MGVDTEGGYVWSAPGKFSIEKFCPQFVDHFLWNHLTGGIGHSKTWQIDLAVLEDGSTKTTFWKGPHWFFNMNYTWDHLHAKDETEANYANYIDSTPWDRANAINPNTVPTDSKGAGEDWYWAADYAGNSWMCAAGNYGYMTFDLDNGANCTITDAAGNVISKGTFNLDVDSHTLSFSDCMPIDPKGGVEKTFRVLYLSEDAMQLITANQLQDHSLNFVTKEYFENWVPDAPKEPELPEGWMDDVNRDLSYTRTWILSPENPLDWCNLDGSRMNGWSSLSDYPDWLGTPDPATYAGFSLKIDSNAKTAVWTLPDGTVMTTPYTLDDKGIYTFENGSPAFNVVGWANFGLDANNGLRIMSIEKNDSGKAVGMWLGARATDKEEYMAWHFVEKK